MFASLCWSPVSVRSSSDSPLQRVINSRELVTSDLKTAVPSLDVIYLAVPMSETLRFQQKKEGETQPAAVRVKNGREIPASIVNYADRPPVLSTISSFIVD